MRWKKTGSTDLLEDPKNAEAMDHWMGPGSGWPGSGPAQSDGRTLNMRTVPATLYCGGSAKAYQKATGVNVNMGCQEHG